MTFRKLFTALIFQTILLTPPCTSYGEDSRGRLPDGRAYRTDEQGVQLVDYIAELELTVENLQRQVKGLEGEARERQALINSLQNGGKAALRIEERDLASSGNETAQPAALQPRAEDCAKKVASCQQQLEDVKVDYEVRYAALQKDFAAKEESFQRLQESLYSKEQEFQAVQARLEQATGKAEAAQAALEAAKEAQQVTAVRQAEAARSAASQSQPAAFVMPVQLDHRRSQAVQALSARMMQDIKSIEGLLASRNALYKKYSRRASDLTPESSSSIQSQINEFKAKIKSAEMVHQLSDIRAGMNSVRGQLQGEIAMMRRVVK